MVRFGEKILRAGAKLGDQGHLLLAGLEIEQLLDGLDLHLRSVHALEEDLQLAAAGEADFPGCSLVMPKSSSRGLPSAITSCASLNTAPSTQRRRPSPASCLGRDHELRSRRPRRGAPGRGHGGERHALAFAAPLRRGFQYFLFFRHAALGSFSCGRSLRIVALPSASARLCMLSRLWIARKSSTWRIMALAPLALRPIGIVAQQGV